MITRSFPSGPFLVNHDCWETHGNHTWHAQGISVPPKTALRTHFLWNEAQNAWHGFVCVAAGQSCGMSKRCDTDRWKWCKGEWSPCGQWIGSRGRITQVYGIWPFELYGRFPRISPKKNRLKKCLVASPRGHLRHLFMSHRLDRPPKINMEPEHDTWKKMQCHHFNRNILRTNPIPRQNLQLILTNRGGGNTEKESAAHEHDMVYVDVLDLGTSFWFQGFKGTTRE